MHLLNSKKHLIGFTPSFLPPGSIPEQPCLRETTPEETITPWPPTQVRLLLQDGWVYLGEREEEGPLVLPRELPRRRRFSFLRCEGREVCQIEVWRLERRPAAVYEVGGRQIRKHLQLRDSGGGRG
jgi:hypothetical protein